MAVDFYTFSPAGFYDLTAPQFAGLEIVATGEPIVVGAVAFTPAAVAGAVQVPGATSAGTFAVGQMIGAATGPGADGAACYAVGSVLSATA